jgi:hypothetical protein
VGVVKDARQAHAEQPLLLGVGPPVVVNEPEASLRGLPRPEDGCQTNLLAQISHAVLLANHGLREIAQTARAQDDLSAGVGAELVAVVATPQPVNLLHGPVAIEDAALTAVALVESQPLLHELTHLRLLSVGHRVVRQTEVRLVLIPVAGLGVAHTKIAEIAQADLGAASHASHDDDLTDLGADLMNLKTVQLATCRVPHRANCKVE